jgi:hypothetical protein
MFEWFENVSLVTLATNHLGEEVYGKQHQGLEMKAADSPATHRAISAAGPVVAA